MTGLPIEEAYDAVEALAGSPGAWATLSVARGTRDAHATLLASRFRGDGRFEVRTEDPSAMAQDCDRTLRKLVRDAAASGRVAVFVTDDQGWDAASLQLPDRHALALVPIRDYALPVDRRRPRRAIEDQDGIVAWTALHYPDEVGDVRRKFLNLMEEAAELAVELGLDTLEMSQAFLRSAARPGSGHPRDDLRGAAGEVGDVGIALVDLAGAIGLRAKDCRTAKMEANEARTPAESRERVARKRLSGL